MGALLPFMTRLMASGTYVIPHVEVDTVSVTTNTVPLSAYRGAGRPEATAAIERAMDVLAAEMGIDPAELRRRNLIAPEAFPFTTPMGATYDCGDYATALDLALATAGYETLRAEQAQRRAAGNPKQLGIGMSTYVEVTNPMGSPEWGAIEITDDGGAIVRAGTSSHGQGHHTAFAMVAHEVTGVPMDRIRFVQSDTDEVPRGGGTGGSRSLQTAGSAVHDASGSSSCPPANVWPTCWRPPSMTSCWTRDGACSTSSDHPIVQSAGPTWRVRHVRRAPYCAPR